MPARDANFLGFAWPMSGVPGYWTGEQFFQRQRAATNQAGTSNPASPKVGTLNLPDAGTSFFYIRHRHQLAGSAIAPDNDHVLAGARLLKEFGEMFFSLG